MQAAVSELQDMKKVTKRGLDEPTKAEIRRRIKQGTTDIYKLAAEFGCGPSKIAGIKAAMTRQRR
jgi:hypothetical protein